MPKTALKNRMKKNELYVVYTNADRHTFELRWLTYGDGTPRIYAKHALDDRILDDTPICTTWKSAFKFLLAGKGPVMIPLSLEVQLKAAPTIRRWAASQREVEPHEVIDYVNRISPPESPDSDSVRSTKRTVALNNRWWVEEHPQGTLSDLLDYVESVRRECDFFDDDAVIADHANEMSDEAHAYFSSWNDFSDPDDGDEPATFAYRRDNIDEEIEDVQELCEVLGGHVTVAELGESLVELAVAG